MTVVDYPDYATPQAHANEIAATGVPLLNGTNLLQQGTLASLAVGSSSLQAAVGIGQISYELIIKCQQAVSSLGAAFLQIRLDWTDTNSGQLLMRRQYEIVAGGNGNDHVVKLWGPAHANQVQINFTNVTGGAEPLQITWVLLASSRPYNRDQARSVLFQQSGFTTGSPQMGYNNLANNSPSVPANGGTATRLLGFYAGQILVDLRTTSGANDAVISIDEANNANSVLPNTVIIIEQRTDAGGRLAAAYTLPPLQCTMTLTNNNAAAQFLSVVITIDPSQE